MGEADIVEASPCTNNFYYRPLELHRYLRDSFLHCSGHESMCGVRIPYFALLNTPLPPTSAPICVFALLRFGVGRHRHRRRNFIC